MLRLGKPVLVDSVAVVVDTSSMTAISFPYPKDICANLRWRIRCRERALVDKRFQDALWEACRLDPLFFFAFALWVHEPRAKVKRRPFIPWSHQEPVILAMEATINEALESEQPVSLTLKKSRAQGGTFTYLGVQIRRALMEPDFTVGLVTRNESLVDSRVDDSAVMFKVAAMLDMLPVWMLPDGYERSMTEHVIRLPNKSGWSGYAATGDVARGGRTTMFCFDEPGSEEFVAGNKDFKILSSVSHVSNCLAGGTLVVTDRGLVPIENVKLHDLVWDGNMWVKQDGCVYQGRQKTIRSYRIRLTPDHRVLTKKGWAHASERLDREEIRLPSGYWQRHAAEASAQSRECVLDSSVQMREGRFRSRVKPDVGQGRRLPVVQGCSHIKKANSSRNVSYMDTSAVGRDEAEMHESKLSEVCRLRRERHHTLRAMDDVREFHGGYGGQAERAYAGQNRQRQGLFPRELPLGYSNRASQQPPKQSIHQDIARDSDDSANCGHCRSDVCCDCETQKEWRRRGCATSSIQVRDDLTEPVYDLLNCGPRRAFTVIDDDGRPLLVHNCIFLVSTFGIDSGVFYEAATDTDNPRVYNLSWMDNPEHSKNIYTVQAGVAVAHRPEEQEAVTQYVTTHQRELRSIERRGHKIEGKVQSPWYNAHRLLPGATPRYIARELDEDCRGAVGKVFATDLLDRMKRTHCQRPVWVGNPVFDSETCKLTGLIPRDDGLLKLWFRPGIDDSPPIGPFTAGCDIASGGVGAYSSNSVMTALDNRTGEQVLEYTIKGLEPRPFARRCVGLCMWLRNALLGWEDSGVSGGFAKEIMEVLYYGNVFFRDVTQLGSQKKSRKPGWPCRDADKADDFEQLALAMEQGKCVPRSEEMIVECAEYEWNGAKIVHSPSKNKGDADKNHADRAIAMAGCWKVFSTDNVIDKIDSSDETGHIPEYGSYLWREQQESRGVKSGCPRYGIRDIIRR